VEQILVMKSKRKDVLVKNVGSGPTLFQSPGEGTPSFKNLWNAARHGKGTSGNPVGAGGRLAGALGLAGKGLAGLQTVNQVAQQAQGGNALGAALGAGYTFEANDPTGRRTANAIQGSAPGPTGPPPPPPPPTPQHVNVGVGSYDANQIKPFNAFSGPQNVAPAPANSTRTGPPPAPVAVNSAIPQLGSAEIASDKSDERYGTKGQAVSYADQQLTQPQPVQPQPMQQPVQSMQQPVQPQLGQQFPSTPVQSMQQPVAPVQEMAQPAPVPPTDPNQTQLPLSQGQNPNEAEDFKQTLLPFQDNLLQEQHEKQLMGGTGTEIQRAEFFASTLMEKLGADTVYKMNPHQIAMVSAYTFLKLS
jgi:hypothetical protein